MRNLLVLCIVTIGFFLKINAQSQDKTDFIFKENKGQWNDNVLFKVNLNIGSVFIENSGITFSFIDFDSEHHHHAIKEKNNHIKGHVIRTHFLNANLESKISTEKESSSYENYFLGNDSAKWTKEVKSYNDILYKDLYPKIDYNLYNFENNLKYDFIINPGGSINDIQIQFDGAEQIYLKQGSLHILTSIVTIIETKPIAYQLINGIKKEVICNFKLEGNILQFETPEGYDEKYQLVIDPTIIFSSYVGSVSDNLAFSSTYDSAGNFFTAGTAYGNSYPTTVGAFDTTFNSTSGLNNFDIVISKFNNSGSALIYSTYLGGTRPDYPQSIICNKNGELYVFGRTESRNFPVSLTGYRTSHSPGGNSDLFVTKFNKFGTNLLASTYVGGNGDDGISMSFFSDYSFVQTTGEIQLDKNDNCVIASSTTSTNFPISSLGISHNGGTSDAIVFKLNPTLSSLLFSTHFGGSLNEQAQGIIIDSSNNIFISGATTSNNLDSAINSFHGGVDGFISKIDSSGNILSSRYIGTNLYDHAFCIDIDNNQDVFLLGQSMGNMPVTPGKYHNPNSHQFIQKFSNSLDTMLFSTVFGSGRNTIDLVPSAFSVHKCGRILISAWGGLSGLAIGTSTLGLPTTPDALQSTTDGNDFYFLALEKDATGIHYATFFGASPTMEHTEGGTNRFDENGNLYQSICASCGANPGVATTPGALSSGSVSWNCGIAVVKFNLGNVLNISPLANYCSLDSIYFRSAGDSSSLFVWNFGDGNTSNTKDPVHLYSNFGNYNVSLSVTDSVGCSTTDEFLVRFNNRTSSILNLSECDSLVSPSGNSVYYVSGIYTDTISNSANCDSSITINLIINNLNNTVVQNGVVNLTSNELGATYQWLDCANGFSPISGATNQTFTATINGNYAVELTKNGCTDTSACFNINSVGINENELLRNISIFPSPTTGTFTLDLGKQTQLNRIFITDLNGRLIKEITPQNVARYEINFEGSTGVYLLNVVGENERKTIKLVKE